MIFGKYAFWSCYIKCIPAKQHVCIVIVTIPSCYGLVQLAVHFYSSLHSEKQMTKDVIINRQLRKDKGCCTVKPCKAN